MDSIFKDPEFKHVEEFIMNFWRPNTEAVIAATERAEVYPLLSQWFAYLIEDPNFEYPDELKISIGPYVNVGPYAKHKMKKVDETGAACYEFLFMYDEIDHTKLTKQQLTIGREDFVDVYQPQTIRNKVFNGAI
jgi:hypothetical protein